MNTTSPGLNALPEFSQENFAAAAEHSLPSGRQIVVRLTSAGEELQVRSPDGDVEVSITLSDRGPVVNLRAARLELEAVDTMALHCRRLEVNTEESTQLHTAGDIRLTGQEMRVKTTGDIHLNGEVIRLNCES
jgi:hypothetical protein